MTMEDKEIKFWISINEQPPFVDECGMNWLEIVKDYKNRMAEEERLGIAKEREIYNNIISTLTKNQIIDFNENGNLPTELLKIVDLDPLSNNLISKKYKNVIMGTLHDIEDAEIIDNIDE